MKRAPGKSITERVKEIERELDLHVPEPFRLVEGEDLPLEREDVAEYREAINSITDIEGLRIVAQRLVTAARNQAHLAAVARESARTIPDRTKRLEDELQRTREALAMQVNLAKAEQARAQEVLFWLKQPWWKRLWGK